MEPLGQFSDDQISVVNDSVDMAEDLVCNHYKMSANQWLRNRYDVKTLADLVETEIVHGPFAQIIRYEGKKKDADLGSSVYDFYKICLQDHSIVAALDASPRLQLFPFVLYIITHELIHIVRFSRFQQHFDASLDEKFDEETRVHDKTHDILRPVRVSGMDDVLSFYTKWRTPID